MRLGGEGLGCSSWAGCCVAGQTIGVCGGLPVLCLCCGNLTTNTLCHVSVLPLAVLAGAFPELTVFESLLYQVWGAVHASLGRANR